MDLQTPGSAMRQFNRLFSDGSLTGFSDSELLDRFAHNRDESAFEALVARHGPLVMSACRAVLHDQNDTEDASQAAFLILAKKARTLRGHAALCGWLYLVAHRVAIRANVARARRRRHEMQAAQMNANKQLTRAALPDEQRQALHEELVRLPEKYRLAVILCDLQGHTQQQAAAQLGLSERTLRRRLTQGRDRLKSRLTRKGFAPECGIMLGPALLRTAETSVPLAWSKAAVRVAVITVNHTASTTLVSTATTALAQEVLRSMLFQKLAWAAVALMPASLLTWGASAAILALNEQAPKPIVASSPASNPRKTEASVPKSEPKSLESPAKVLIRGTVVGPDGRPVAGASLYQTPGIGYLEYAYETRPRATTGPDGSFAFPVPETTSPGERPVVTASAPNLGPGWVKLTDDTSSDSLTISLVPDDTPITGQIIDLEGKPVPGVTLRVLQINAAPNEDLGPWLAEAKTSKYERIVAENHYFPGYTVALSPTVTTDAAGRFRLNGIGRNRLVVARIDGPRIVSQQIHMITRLMPSVDISDERPGTSSTDPRPSLTYYGATFRHVSAPTKPIVGVVRDIDTHQPLGGLKIESFQFATRPYYLNRIVHTTTDDQGQYRLIGMPKGTGNQIIAIPGPDQPYLASYKIAPDTNGLEPVTVDIELKRGVWIEGKITDKVTGKPVPASVEYFARYPNANLSDYPGFDGAVRPFEGTPSKADGSYRLVGLPGPGLVAVHQVRDYLRANDREDQDGTNEKSLRTAPYHLGFTSNYTAIASIDPAKGAESIHRDITLDPGWTYKINVIGPDGQPLAGAIGVGYDFVFAPMKTAEFTMRASNPRKPRDRLLQHPSKRLVGLARPPKKNGESITVQMTPAATVTGRLVDANGKPRPDLEYRLAFHMKNGPAWAGGILDPYKPLVTDKNGRFEITCLPPGYEFELSAAYETLSGKPLFGKDVRPGETKDLGDIHLERPKP